MLVNLRSPARADSNRDSLGHLELLVLLAALRLGGNVLSKSIAGAIAEAGFPAHISAVYTSISRLEKKGMIQVTVGAKTSVLGGRARRYLTVSGHGERTARRVLKVIRALAENSL